MESPRGLRAWLGPWIITLVVTAALLVLTGLLQMTLGFYAGFALVGASSIWAAWDSRRIGVQRYRSQMSNEPVIVLFMCVVFWILAFPWYLVIRQGIRRGLVPLKEPTG